jgi:hypothetical protein
MSNSFIPSQPINLNLNKQNLKTKKNEKNRLLNYGHCVIFYG